MADLLRDRQKKLNTAVALGSMTVSRGCTPDEAESAKERLASLCEKYRFSAQELRSGYATLTSPSEPKSRETSDEALFAKFRRTSRMWHGEDGLSVPIEELDDNSLMNAFIGLSEEAIHVVDARGQRDFEKRMGWLAEEAKRRGLDLCF